MPTIASPITAAPVMRRAVVMRDGPRRASRTDAATTAASTHAPMTTCHAGASTPRRPLSPNVATDRSHGPIQLGERPRWEGPGALRTGDPGGNAAPRFDADPTHHVTFPLPA